jgi:hypothetical protein
VRREKLRFLSGELELLCLGITASCRRDLYPVIAVRLVEENLKLLKAEWRRIHG